MASQEKHQEQYDIELPQSIVDSFARFLVPEIRKLYASEEGQKELEEWKKKYQGKKTAILEAYAKMDTENPYVRIQKALYAEGQGHLKETEELWKNCTKDCPPGFQWELIEIAVRNQFLLEPMLKKMPPEAWNEYAEAVTGNKKWTEMEAFYPKLMPLLDGFPFYRRRLDQCYLEKLLTRELLEASRLRDLLMGYCESVLTDAQAVYKEEALAAPETYALPTRYRFASALINALNLIDAGKLIESFPFLKESLKIYPKMSGAVGQLLRYLEEEIQSPKQVITEEFMLLGEQVKQILRGLINGGQWDEAYGVMEQLLSLLPDDLEVLQMKQEILRQGAKA